VIWEVNGGVGVFEGATGRITSNFLVNEADGSFVDNQFGTLFLQNQTLF
jgi:hypothetical protein